MVSKRLWKMKMVRTNLDPGFGLKVSGKLFLAPSSLRKSTKANHSVFGTEADFELYCNAPEITKTPFNGTRSATRKALGARSDLSGQKVSSTHSQHPAETRDAGPPLAKTRRSIRNIQATSLLPKSTVLHAECLRTGTFYSKFPCPQRRW